MNDHLLCVLIKNCYISNFIGPQLALCWQWWWEIEGTKILRRFRSYLCLWCPRFCKCALFSSIYFFQTICFAVFVIIPSKGDISTRKWQYKLISTSFCGFSGIQMGFVSWRGLRAGKKGNSPGHSPRCVQWWYSKRYVVNKRRIAVPSLFFLCSSRFVESNFKIM